MVEKTTLLDSEEKKVQQLKENVEVFKVDEENKDKEIYEFNQLVQEKQKTSIDYFEQVVHFNELLEEKHKLLIEKGFKIENSNKENLIKELNLKNIYNDIFKNKDLYLEKLYEKCFDDEVFFDENEKKYSEIKDVIEKYYREYGLSIEDIYKLNS